MLSDEQIATMTPQARRDLMLRLRSPLSELLTTPERLHRIRTIRLTVVALGSLLLVPWTLYLAYTLPDTESVTGWKTVWVGYDVLLMTMLLATAWLGWRRRLAAVLTSFGTGVLVLADAWFDVLTSSRFETWVAIATALFVEVPVAVLLIGASIRLLRLSTLRFLLLPASTSFWRLPLLLIDDDVERPAAPGAATAPAAPSLRGPGDG